MRRQSIRSTSTAIRRLSAHPRSLASRHPCCRSEHRSLIADSGSIECSAAPRALASITACLSHSRHRREALVAVEAVTLRGYLSPPCVPLRLPYTSPIRSLGRLPEPERRGAACPPSGAFSFVLQVPSRAPLIDVGEAPGASQARGDVGAHMGAPLFLVAVSLH